MYNPTELTAISWAAKPRSCLFKWSDIPSNHVCIRESTTLLMTPSWFLCAAFNSAGGSSHHSSHSLIPQKLLLVDFASKKYHPMTDHHFGNKQITIIFSISTCGHTHFHIFCRLTHDVALGEKSPVWMILDG